MIPIPIFLRPNFARTRVTPFLGWEKIQTAQEGPGPVAPRSAWKIATGGVRVLSGCPDVLKNGFSGENKIHFKQIEAILLRRGSSKRVNRQYLYMYIIVYIIIIYLICTYL